MAKATSPVRGQRYGIQRVCCAWGVPRSSFYAAQAPKSQATTERPASAGRGPTPAISDNALLAAIQRDLDTSPRTGEGHRKMGCGCALPVSGPQSAAFCVSCARTPCRRPHGSACPAVRATITAPSCPMRST